MSDERLIPLAALQHFAFCPRQCALIHLEQHWEENYLTAQGQQLHQRVDQGEPETRQGVRLSRAVAVSAPLLGLTGKLDLLETQLGTGELCPVEYKRGKPKKSDCDAIQLCAQALCLEEMTGKCITQAALWYGQTRRRLPVALDASLRARTLAVIGAVKALFQSGITPKAPFGKHCLSCSLQEICQPKLLTRDSKSYLRQLYEGEDEVTE